MSVPWGRAETLAEGAYALITQRLGGTITVMSGGNLYRIDERDADALGLEPQLPDAAPAAHAQAVAGGQLEAEALEQPDGEQLLEGANGILVPGGFGDRGTRDLMVSLLRDRNDRIREVAYKWLERHPDPVLAKTLLAALQTDVASVEKPVGASSSVSGVDTVGNTGGSAGAAEPLPVYVVNSTFGGAPELGNTCSNGGGLSSIGVSHTVINSLFTHNTAVGNGANPAKAGTPGGGSGAAISAGASYFIGHRGLSGNAFYARFIGAENAALLVVVGLTTAIVSARRTFAAGDEGALTFLAIPFGDMAVFSILAAAAIYYRRWSEAHKRLMLLATVGILDAAIARGRLGERVPVRGRDELALLGRTFNGMAEQLQSRLVELEVEATERAADALKQKLADFEGIPDLGLPAGIKADLRPYQKEGFNFLCHLTDTKLGGILADDMGLGKTIQVIALHLHLLGRGRGPTLVVCPSTLLGTWEREFARFAPDVPTRRYHGAGRSLSDLSPDEVVLTTYGVVRQDHRVLGEVFWGLAVADEAQHAKKFHLIGYLSTGDVTSDAMRGIIIDPEDLSEKQRKLLELVPGPDFPTGGELVATRSDLAAMYETGRGTFKLRGRWKASEGKEGTTIVITEIPYQVNKANLITKIAELVREKKLEGISDIRDESDRDGMRIVIELKREAVPKVVLNNLYKHTDLQTNFGANMLALVDGVPRTLSLDAFIRHWVTHQIEVIVRRTRFRLRKAEERAHILRGLLKALDAIDEVIALIRRSDTVEVARGGLMSLLEIDEIQANAILEMQLRRLAALERQKIIDELERLEALIADLKDILEKPERQRAIISEELAEIVENGDVESPAGDRVALA